MSSKFKETLTDLRRKKREGVKLNRKERFRLLASKSAKRWHKTGWSSPEIKVRKILGELGYKEHIDYTHNQKLISPSKEGLKDIFKYLENNVCIGSPKCVLIKTMLNEWKSIENIIKYTKKNYLKKLEKPIEGNALCLLLKKEYNDSGNTLPIKILKSGGDGEPRSLGGRMKEIGLRINGNDGSVSEISLSKKREENVKSVALTIKEHLFSIMKAIQSIPIHSGITKQIGEDRKNGVDCLFCVQTVIKLLTQKKGRINNFEIDFYFPSKRIAIEVSPRIYHEGLGPNVINKDIRKKRWLIRLGLRYFKLGDEYFRRRKGTKAKLKKRLISILDKGEYIQ